MATRRHQELLAWQEAMSLARAVYSLTQSFPRDEMFGLTAQMRRAAVSVPSNIAEGAARGTKKEFVHFLHVARGSLNEIDTQTKLAQSLSYSGDFAELDSHLERVFKLLAGLINSLKVKE